MFSNSQIASERFDWEKEKVRDIFYTTSIPLYVPALLFPYSIIIIIITFFTYIFYFICTQFVKSWTTLLACILFLYKSVKFKPLCPELRTGGSEIEIESSSKNTEITNFLVASSDWMLQKEIKENKSNESNRRIRWNKFYKNK